MKTALCHLTACDPATMDEESVWLQELIDFNRSVLG